MKDSPYPSDPSAPPHLGFQPVAIPMPPPPGYGYPAGAGYGYAQPAGYSAGYPPPPAYPSPGYPATGSSSYVEPEATTFNNNSGILNDTPSGWETFSDKAIRRVFVRKVYSILMIQLAFTTAVIALFIFVEPVKLTVQKNLWMYIAAYVIFLVLYFVLVCCEGVRRTWPTNIILLSLFTVALSYMVGTISSFHDTNIVLMAMGICAACCLAVTLFSFNTKYDLTSCGGILFILCFVLFLFGLIAIFTYNQIVHTVYAACGALLFMLFLAYDTQMLMGGKKHELSPEEHIFAALQLYLDVVYIFIFILALMGKKN